MPSTLTLASRHSILFRCAALGAMSALLAVGCAKESHVAQSVRPVDAATMRSASADALLSEKPDDGLMSSTSSREVGPMDPTIAKIREEGIDRSQVMQTLDYLCNVIGPRLTASQRLRDANEWTRQRLEGWGLTDAHLEEWGPFGREWNVRRFSLQGVDPFAFNVIGYPRAWSQGLSGPTTAEVVFLDAQNEEDLAKYHGKLQGKFVLIGQPRTVEARFLPLATRQEDDRLQRLAELQPGQSSRDAAPVVENAAERRARFMASSGRNEALLSSRATAPASQPASRPSTDPFTSRLVRFAADEGAALMLFPSTTGDGGTFFVTSVFIPPPVTNGTTAPATQPRYYQVGAPQLPPQVTLAVEDYNRLARGSRLGQTFKLQAELNVEFSDDVRPVFNTIAEIPGSDLKDQVVMVGAHLDSWHSGTGATDNGVGSACAMEAVRIIRALNLHPRRTIRVGLWTGEEEGILGSGAYVKQHFGYVETPEPPTVLPTTRRGTTQHADPATEPEGGSNNPATRPAPRRQGATSPSVVKLGEYEKLSVYFNLDNGTGRIRGVYAQGNTAAVPLFQEWLKPFHDLGAQTVTITNTSGTDHLSFDRIGLPGFQFIQDPIEYNTRTHHSNEDVFDRIQPEDMKQASTIMAAFLWNAANMDQRFPRKPLDADGR